MREDASTPAVQHLREDELLGDLVREQGTLRLEPVEDFFARFVQSIASQQVSTASARAIFGRLESRTELTPAVVSEVDPAELRDAGLSGQKAETVIEIALAFEERGWSRGYFEGMSNEAVIQELTTVHGVGVWTAKMQLIFSLARPDVFPVEDLGIRRAMETLVNGQLEREEMVELAQPWRPYRSLASRYLWGLTDG